jgi:hypothetical protein
MRTKTLKTLKQIAGDMKSLCDAIPTSKSLTKKERATLEHRALSAVEELEMNYGRVAFVPEVPKATEKMFFKLYDFLGYDVG